jgi:hypothetical protein
VGVGQVRVHAPGLSVAVIPSSGGSVLGGTPRLATGPLGVVAERVAVVGLGAAQVAVGVEEASEVDAGDDVARVGVERDDSGACFQAAVSSSSMARSHHSSALRRGSPALGGGVGSCAIRRARRTTWEASKLNMN